MFCLEAESHKHKLTCCSWLLSMYSSEFVHVIVYCWSYVAWLGQYKILINMALTLTSSRSVWKVISLQKATSGDNHCLKCCDLYIVFPFQKPPDWTLTYVFISHNAVPWNTFLLFLIILFSKYSQQIWITPLQHWIHCTTVGFIFVIIFHYL